jgi:MFS family permease
VLELSGSASSLGLVLAAQGVPLAALALVGGVVGDRVSRQRVMLASDPCARRRRRWRRRC